MVTRITGMASGMDIDGMVKKLMTAESKPLDKMNQQKQLMEWKRENYREVSTKLVSFLQDKLQKLNLSSATGAQKTTITGDSSAVTANASSTASGTMSITVSNLASASQVTSNSVAAAKATKDADGKTVIPLISGVGGSSGTVKINDKDVSYNPAGTIADFVNSINTNKDAGVTAVYDSINGRLSITNKETGDKAIKLEGGVFDTFKISDSSALADKNVSAGVDATVIVNGLEMKQPSNQFDINGVTLTLNKVSETGKSTQVQVVKDVDKIVENVQSFVDAYNSVLASLNNKVDEERYTKYTPLTKDQRSGMSDDEAKLWTDKAKSGMLKNDSILRETLSSMRSAMMQGVDVGVKDSTNQIMTMRDLGITTGTYDTNGKLILNTEKLKAALEKDPEIVSTFFGQKDSSNALGKNYSQKEGILTKLQKVTNISLQKMADTAGTSKVSSDLSSTFLSTSSMGEALTSLDRRISEMTSKLNTIETNYYKKFTAMETAINRYNSTSSSLAGM